MTEDEAMRDRWKQATMDMRPVLLEPLPRKVRLRLAAQRAVTDVGIWLGDHVSWRAADWWYRTVGRLA